MRIPSVSDPFGQIAAQSDAQIERIASLPIPADASPEIAALIPYLNGLARWEQRRREGATDPPPEFPDDVKATAMSLVASIIRMYIAAAQSPNSLQ